MQLRIALGKGFRKRISFSHLLHQSFHLGQHYDIIQRRLHQEDGGLLQPNQQPLRDDRSERNAMRDPVIDEIDADPSVSTSQRP